MRPFSPNSIKNISIDLIQVGNRLQLAMKMLISFLSCVLFPCMLLGQSDPVMIRLVDPLDEPEFYCVDIPGFRQNVQLKAPLMAHTLKRFGSADEMFVMDYPKQGQIYAVEYGLCIEAAGTESGAQLFLKKPSDSPLQRFTLSADGKLVLKDHPQLGFAIDSKDGTKAGGPSHLRRDLSLQKVSDTPAKLSTWKLVKSASTWPE